MLGQKNVAPKLAVQFDIPLVFYGENEAEYGNPIDDTSSAERDWKYFTTADPDKLAGNVPHCTITTVAESPIDPRVLLVGTDDGNLQWSNDGGASWTAQFVNDVPEAFFDCMDFWDATHGIAFSDAVDGAFVIIRTTDGETWDYIPFATIPAAQDGEGSFAASAAMRALTASGACTARSPTYQRTVPSDLSLISSLHSPMRFLPKDLAQYMAASASKISASAEPATSRNDVTPRLTVTPTPLPSVALATSRRSRSATCTVSLASAPGSSTVNSSPP
jgi:hypothetical protein